MHKILWNRPVNVSMDNLSHIARNSTEVVYINFNDRSGLLGFSVANEIEDLIYQGITF